MFSIVKIKNEKDQVYKDSGKEAIKLGEEVFTFNYVCKTNEELFKYIEERRRSNSRTCLYFIGGSGTGKSSTIGLSLPSLDCLFARFSEEFLKKGKCQVDVTEIYEGISNHLFKNVLIKSPEDAVEKLKDLQQMLHQRKTNLNRRSSRGSVVIKMYDSSNVIYFMELPGYEGKEQIKNESKKESKEDVKTIRETNKIRQEYLFLPLLFKDIQNKRTPVAKNQTQREIIKVFEDSEQIFFTFTLDGTNIKDTRRTLDFSITAQISLKNWIPKLQKKTTSMKELETISSLNQSNIIDHSNDTFLEKENMNLEERSNEIKSPNRNFEEIPIQVQNLHISYTFHSPNKRKRESESVSKKKKKMNDGFPFFDECNTNWICLQCQTSNTESCMNCIKCHKLKKRVPNDWNCPNCEFDNFSRNITCFKCNNERKNEYIIYSKDWKCGNCKFANFAKNDTCCYCNMIKNESLNGFMYFKMPLMNHIPFQRNDWMCIECHVVNFNEICRYCCGTNKEDVKLIE